MSIPTNDATLLACVLAHDRAVAESKRVTRVEIHTTDRAQLAALGHALLTPEEARTLRLREAGMGTTWPSCADHFAD
jgi:hypothetical protein